MNYNHIDPGMARFEAARAALAEATRALAFENVARLLEILPPAGIDGWINAWTAGVLFARETAERWLGAAKAAPSCAEPGPDHETLRRLGRQLALVESETLVLIERLARAAEA